MKFEELGLVPELMNAVKRAGFEETTPIQEGTIPLGLAGKDVIGQAQTGTGKTAAFGLPMLQKIDTKNRNVQGIVVAPTRELAIQTQEELFRLGRDKKVKVQVVYGGANIGRQIRGLKEGPHIIVGTPGRLLDHLNRRTLKLNHVETLVLDEADEMLNMGFLEDIEKIISYVPKERQTLLFSATMPNSIKQIGVKFMKNPEHIAIKGAEMTASLIDQYYVRCKDFEKFDVMTRLLDVQNPEQTIVFCRTKRRVDEVSRGLELRGYTAEGIHGDLSQQQRMSVLRSFKNGRLDTLVATDVAARGLDISGVTHVYNYDIPQDPESYVHRIGRTGRAGSEGMSVTFVTPNEMSYLRVIEELTKKRMTPLRPPTQKEAAQGQIGLALEEIEKELAKNNLDEFQKEATDLLEQSSAEDIAALLIKVMSKDPTTEVPVTITPERPLPANRGKGGQGNRNKNQGNRNRNQGNRNRNRNQGNRNNQGNRGNKNTQGNRNKQNNKGQQGKQSRQNNQQGGSRDFVIRNKSK